MWIVLPLMTKLIQSFDRFQSSDYHLRYGGSSMNFVYHPAITLTISTIQFVLWFIAAALILPEKYSRRTTVIGLLISVGLFYVIPFLPALHPLRVISGLILVSVTVQVFFQGKWYFKLLVSSLILVVMALSEGLMIPLTPRNLPADEISFSNQLTLNLIYLFIHVVLLTAMVVCVRYIQKRSRGEVFNRQIFLFLLFPISQYFAFAGWFIQEPPYINVGAGFAFTGVLLFLAADVGLYFAMSAVSRTTALRVQNELLQTQVVAEQEHYASLAENYEDIRRMRHDIDNHLYTIRALLTDGNVEEASRYADEIYRSELFAVHQFSGCENTVVASFLLHKQKEFSDRSVTLDAEVSLPAHLKISNLDLICALGNLLDNAGEACSSIPGAVVHLQVQFLSPYLQIMVSNPFAAAASPKQRRIPELSRGIGTEILTRLANRYDGHYESSQAEGVYTARLYLKDFYPDESDFSAGG